MTMSEHPVVDGIFTIDPLALLGAHCDACDQYSFPRLSQCPYCGAEDVHAVALSDHGTLWGWTTVTTAPPGYLGAVPYGFGVVELPEGVRIVTRLAVPSEHWTFGQPMALRSVALHTDDAGDAVITWEFAP